MKVNKKYSLGCGEEIRVKYQKGIQFICGVANGWGEERLCKECDSKMRRKWDEDDKEKLLKDQKLEGGIENGIHSNRKSI